MRWYRVAIGMAQLAELQQKYDEAMEKNYHELQKWQQGQKDQHEGQLHTMELQHQQAQSIISSNLVQK